MLHVTPDPQARFQSTAATSLRAFFAFPFLAPSRYYIFVESPRYLHASLSASPFQRLKQMKLQLKNNRVHILAVQKSLLYHTQLHIRGAFKF